LSLAFIGCCGLRKPSEQSRHNSNVLALAGKERQTLVILVDPLVDLSCGGARLPSVSTMAKLALDPLLVLCPLSLSQLLDP
jgi:hypothetical protein